MPIVQTQSTKSTNSTDTDNSTNSTDTNTGSDNLDGTEDDDLDGMYFYKLINHRVFYEIPVLEMFVKFTGKHQG